MNFFMKKLNNISRSQAIYRAEAVGCEELSAAHFSFVLAICRAPGRSQEELAEDLCLNKSTVTRALSCLEERGFVRREPSPADRRQYSVYPTEKMLEAYPRVKSSSISWMELISEGIPKEEMEIFSSVLDRMESRAREITGEEQSR